MEGLLPRRPSREFLGPNLGRMDEELAIFNNLKGLLPHKMRDPKIKGWFQIGDDEKLISSSPIDGLTYTNMSQIFEEVRTSLMQI